MSNYGVFTDPGTLRFERMLPGPVERVWAYLTESDKMKTWLAAMEIEAKIGGKVVLHFNHKNLATKEDPVPEKYKDMEEGSTSTGRVTRYEPPRVLAYTWDEESVTDSEVTFELIPKEDNQVLLILTHRRLGDDRDMHIGVGAGWHNHLDILELRLRGQQPKTFWKPHMWLEDEYSKRIPS